MDSLFIDDGMNLVRTVPAVAGLYPELKIQYRPALRREQITYRQLLQTADAATIDSHEVDLIARYGVTLNGVSLREREKVAKLKPAVRVHVQELILGYTPADQETTEKNS
jgi:hypothetical protein